MKPTTLSTAYKTEEIHPHKGLKMKQKFTDQQYIGYLQLFFQSHERTPSIRDWRTCRPMGAPSDGAYVKRFGTWRKAIALAGLMVREPSAKKRLLKTCSNCELSFERRLGDIKKNKSGQFFCSVLCRAIVQNVEIPRKRLGPQGKCSKCETIIAKKHTYCGDCWRAKRKSYVITDKTIEEVSLRWSGPTNKHTRIREHARRFVKDFLSFHNLEKKCQVCDYKTITEVAHIKPVSKFSNSSKISEVNGIDNLSILCPNHHKEFDKGFRGRVPTLKDLLKA